MTAISLQWPGLVALLRCPMCHDSLSVLEGVEDVNGQRAVLGHRDGPCQERYQVIDGIPRLLTGVAERESLDKVVVSRFDAEWANFADADTAEQSEIFRMYFDLVPPAELGPGRTVLDAGCGAGRWAVQVAKRGAQVVALDAGRSVEIAYRNGAPWRIAGVQGDVTSLPFDSARFDFVYSLGVLHHVEATDRALSELVRVLRPGGTCLVYLYYALDGRGPAFRAIHGAVGLIRRVVSRWPQVVLVLVTTTIAALVYLPLARMSRALRGAGLRGVAAALPLSAYADRSFKTMRNDSLDRFGTRLEKRYTRSEITQLMRDGGLVDILVADSAPYWHAVGRRPD